MKTRWKTRCLLSVLLFCLMLLGCSRPKERVESRAYSKEFRSGNSTVKLHLDKTKLKLEESIEMLLEVETPEGVVVTLPEQNQGLKQFSIEKSTTTPSVLTDDDRMLYQRRLTLGAYAVSGEIAIEPMTITFEQKGENGKSSTFSIETERVPLAVEMPPNEYWEQLTLDTSANRIFYEHLHPRFWRHWMTISLVILGGAALIAGVWFLLRRKKHHLEPPPLPPEVIALQALERLKKEHLAEKGDVMTFYNQVQQILRNYIEGRFKLQAPERTTEEFLAELRLLKNSPITEHKQLLERFLQHCDMVRFATYIPQLEERMATFDSCQAFVRETACNSEEKANV